MSPGRWKLNRKTGRTIPSEHSEQVALMQWAALAECHRPMLGLLHAIPNGGQRHPAIAAKLKREGVKRGVPDLCLPVARCGLHGLYLELKAADGRLSNEQKRWVDMLTAQGYGVAVVYGFDEARAVLEDYLDDKWSLSEHFKNRDSSHTANNDLPEAVEPESRPYQCRPVPSGGVGRLHRTPKRTSVRRRTKS